MATTTVSVEQLYAAYYEFMPTIYTQFLASRKDTGLMVEPLVAGDGVKLRSETLAEVAQPYQNDYTQKGGFTLANRTLQLRRAKYDTDFNPNDFTLGRYDSFLRQRGINDPYDFPYEAWIVMSIMRRFWNDIETQVKWSGTYTAPTAGTAGAASTIADGLKTQIGVDQALGTPISTEITTGAATVSTALADVETLVFTAINTEEKTNVPWVLFCSQATLNNYRRNHSATRGAFTLVPNSWNLQTVEGMPNVTLVSQAGLSGAGMILTPANNFVMGEDGAPSFNAEKYKRVLSLFGDYLVGYAIADMRQVYINDDLLA